jgi:hypothetical protein
MFSQRLPLSLQLAIGGLILAGGLAVSPAQAASAAWNRGCSDAKVGSYDRSSHSADYEKGWQSCKQQQEKASSGGHSKSWQRGCSDAKVGSYDRSKHSADYEAGWQACNKD